MKKNPLIELKKEFTEKFTYKAPADICEAYFNIPNSLWVCSQNAEEVWSWFESKLQEYGSKKYIDTVLDWRGVTCYVTRQIGVRDERQTESAVSVVRGQVDGRKTGMVAVRRLQELRGAVRGLACRAAREAALAVLRGRPRRDGQRQRRIRGQRMARDSGGP